MIARYVRQVTCVNHHSDIVGVLVLRLLDEGGPSERRALDRWVCDLQRPLGWALLCGVLCASRCDLAFPPGARRRTAMLRSWYSRFSEPPPAVVVACAWWVEVRLRVAIWVMEWAPVAAFGPESDGSGR